MPSRLEKEAQDVILGEKILTMVAAGGTVTGAATQLEISRRQAERIYHQHVQRFYDDHASLRKELVGRELKTFDLLQRKMMQQALEGDQRAVDRVLAIMKQRAEMLGLNKATQVEVQVSRVDDALEELVAMIDGSLAASGLGTVPLVIESPVGDA